MKRMRGVTPQSRWESFCNERRSRERVRMLRENKLCRNGFLRVFMAGGKQKWIHRDNWLNKTTAARPLP